MNNTEKGMICNDLVAWKVGWYHFFEKSGTGGTFGICNTGLGFKEIR